LLQLGLSDWMSNKGMLLCRDIDTDMFGSRLYQWASTLTYASKNMPFALPFRTNPLQTGFEVLHVADVPACAASMPGPQAMQHPRADLAA
jgi:hypothetical protein